MLGPGTYTRSLHYTHERRRPSPFSPGRDSALSALSRSLLDWTNCTILVVVCQRQFRAAARMRLQFHFLFIYWMLRAKRRKKKEEERKSIWLFIRVGAVVYFSHHSTAAETTKEISIYRASAASAASRSNAIIPGRV